MRMWMVDPQLLCKKHLLGEHGEVHKHRHNFVKKHNLARRVAPIVQIEPANMKIRHDALAAEMLRRGMNHKSPYEMPDISYLPEHVQNAKADIAFNLNDLKTRCSDCKKLIEREICG